MALLGKGEVRFTYNENWFTVIFSRFNLNTVKQVTNVAKSSEEKFRRNVEKILALIKNNPNISAREIARDLELTSRAIEKYIAFLKL